MRYMYDIDSDETISVVLKDFEEIIRNARMSNGHTPFSVELSVGSTDGAAVWWY